MGHVSRYEKGENMEVDMKEIEEARLDSKEIKEEKQTSEDGEFDSPSILNSSRMQAPTTGRRSLFESIGSK